MTLHLTAEEMEIVQEALTEYGRAIRHLAQANAVSCSKVGIQLCQRRATVDELLLRLETGVSAKATVFPGKLRRAA